MKKTSEKQSFILLIIGIIIFLMIIHLLFSISAPFELLTAKWSAGDILTFAGTVLLGLLALWQNIRFKKENDIAQTRLENLSIQSNEFAVINKIIEVESKNLDSLIYAFDIFLESCNTHKIASIYLDKKDDNHFLLEAAIFEKNLDESFYVLSRELRKNSALVKNDKHPLKESFTNMYSFTKDLIAAVRKKDMAKQIQLAEIVNKTMIEFVAEREKYLVERQQILNSVMYENMSLKEIKAKYYIP